MSSRAIVGDLLRAFARTFEVDNKCECVAIGRANPDAPFTATDHRTGCPVDTAARADLAKAGIA